MAGPLPDHPLPRVLYRDSAGPRLNTGQLCRHWLSTWVYSVALVDSKEVAGRE